MNVSSGRQKTFKVSGKKITGFSVNAFIKHGTTNTDLANSDFLPENVNISIYLMRNGKRIGILPTANLKVLNLDSNYYNAGWEKSCANMAAAAATVLVEKGVGIYEQWLYELGIKLQNPIDCSENDEIGVEINFQSSAVSANVSTADSYLDIVEITDQWGYEFSTPQIDQEAIVASEAKFEKSYANLQDLKYINTDKTDLLTASAPINQSALSSKMLSYTDTYNEMLAKRMLAFPTKAISDARLQSFDLYEGDTTPSATLVLTLTSSNINANKNFLVSRTAITSQRLYTLAEARKAKHEMNKARRNGIAVNQRTLQDVYKLEASLIR